jgi:hypothetical protein
MILQFLQIFLTDALTFMRSLLPLIESAYLSASAVVAQIRFLHHALVLMAHCMRLHLRHEVHRYNNENE